MSEGSGSGDGFSLSYHIKAIGYPRASCTSRRKKADIDFFLTFTAVFLTSGLFLRRKGLFAPPRCTGCSMNQCFRGDDSQGMPPSDQRSKECLSNPRSQLWGRWWSWPGQTWRMPQPWLDEWGETSTDWKRVCSSKGVLQWF